MNPMELRHDRGLRRYVRMVTLAHIREHAVRFAELLAFRHPGARVRVVSAERGAYIGMELADGTKLLAVGPSIEDAMAEMMRIESINESR